MNAKFHCVTSAERATAARRSVQQGFTLLDLMAALAVICLLACVIAPGLARTKSNGQSIQCLSNTRRLVNAWQMYAQDNNDNLVVVFHGGNAQAGNFDPTLGPGWAEGWLDWTTSSDNTNQNFLINQKYARFAPYFSAAPNIYQCPSDTFVSATQRAFGWTRRARSYSINITLGPGNALGGPWDSTYFQVKKISQMRFPSPADTWVFLDEHPDSINDPAFWNPTQGSWIDYPARYHNGATSLSFADGHVEMHQWKSVFASSRGAEVRYNWDFNELASPGDPDIHWMSYHAQRQTIYSY